MKTLSHALLQNVRRLGWACLWSIPICLLLLSRPAVAAPQDIDFGPAGNCAVANPLFDIDAVVGNPINLPITVINSPDPEVDWSFDLPPTSVIPAPPCTGGPDSFTCSNVTIAIPPGVVTIGNPGANAGVTSANPNSPGRYSFTLQATEQGNNGGAGGLPFNLPCSRDYNIKISRPFDIGFVLDRSGSMNNSSADPINVTLTRWEALKEGVEGFINILTAGNVGAPELSPAPVGSRFGLTLFNGDVIPNASFPSSLVPINNSLWTNVNTELTSQIPSGWTSIGDGLEDSINNKLIDSSRSRGIVLFTDGDQNRSLYVTADGLRLSDNKDGTGNSVAIPTSIKVATIGVGSPDAEYLGVLERLAETHNSHAFVTTNGTQYRSPDGIILPGGIPAAFLQAGINLLSENSPLFVANYAGTLQTKPVELPEFAINQNLKLLLINFNFSRKFKQAEIEAILDGVHIYRDGIEVTKYFQRQIVSEFTSWAVLKTDFAVRDEDQNILDKLASDGSYLIKLVKPRGIEDFDFQISPIADDSRLHVEWGVQPTSRKVFEPMKPRVTLFWRDQPLTDAEVYANILIPGDDLGDLLARNDTVVKPNQDRQDPNSPGYQKYLFLLENEPEFIDQLAFKDNRIQLTDPEGDGSYEASLMLGDISGEYQIIYQIFAKDPIFGTPIQRVLFQSAYTRFGDIDLTASSISNAIDANGRPTISWRPMTTYGRYMGPANASAIQVRGSQEVTIRDRQDGSYIMSFGDIRPESKISISLLGKEIYRGPVGKFGQNPQSTCVGWFCRIRDWFTKFPRRNFDVRP